MSSRLLKTTLRRVPSLVFLLVAIALISSAQQPVPPGTSLNGPQGSGLATIVPMASLECILRDKDGSPIHGGAVITLLRSTGQAYEQKSTKSDKLVFVDVPQTEYTVQVVAPGYRTLEQRIDIQNERSRKLTITLEALSAEEAALQKQVATLPPKAQKEMGKAIEALNGGNPANARGHLDALMKMAPNHAEVNYLYGVYASKTNDEQHATIYWAHALEADPRHLRALLSLSQAYLEEKKLDEAGALAKRAEDADPSSWRAQALLAGVAQQQNEPENVITHAQRALELGHSQATVVEPILAAALARRGEKDRAVALLQSYLHDNPADQAATKELAAIQANTFAVEPGSNAGSALAEAASEMPLAKNWLPPDIDEKMPPVQGAAACSVTDVVGNAGKRVEEFVKNTEKFTATESLVHQSIDKWGVASPAITRKFNYVAGVQEVRPGLFNFDEYRHSSSGEDRFPDGIATDGLPALVMIFHPYYAPTFDMSCEGLSSWNGAPVWQVHFRQRPGETKSLRSYKLGMDGPSYTVALRGRAWIAADTFQVVRLETDLVSPIPQIQLRADHTIIEYAPVQFRQNQLEMWLPHTAEVYFDWRGRRMHRVHSFGNYLLFAIDDKQKISAPKSQASSGDPQPEP